MSLSAGSLASLYDAFTAIGADKTAVSEMLAQFPTDDDDRPVTRLQLTAETAALRAEATESFATIESQMAKGFATVDTKFAAIDTRFATVDTRFATVESQMAKGFAAVDTRFATVESQMAKGFAAVQTEMAELRRRTLVEIRIWIGFAVVILGLVRFLT